MWLKVKDIMRKNVTTFRTDDQLEYILKTFAKEKITSAPVVEGKEFVGIVCMHRMIKYFSPTKFLGMWKRGKPIPTEALKKTIAIDIFKKHKTVCILNPEDELSNVLGKMSREQDSLPVVQNGKLVGIVQQGDIVRVFLKQLSAGEYPKKMDSTSKKSKGEICTELDTLLRIVDKKREISARKVGKEMGISTKTVEDMAECLHKHQLIELKYLFLRGAVLRSVEHENGEA